MYKEPESMKEIHDIRLKLHKEMKNMTAKEKADKINKEAEATVNKYGLKFNSKTNKSPFNPPLTKMYKEPESMREIHEIREKLYEEEKGLTTSERIAKIHKEAQYVIKKYGLKFKTKTHNAS